MVPARYLQLLMDIPKISEYACGAAALAYVYLHLGIASRKKVKQITGLLSLVEVWSYEHLNVERPLLDDKFTWGQALYWRWDQPRTQPINEESMLVLLREQLDALRQEGVIWNPYRKGREFYPLPPTTFCSRCLVCFDIVEPYMPDTVLRQFDHVQSIPQSPLAPTGHSIRGSSAKGYTVSYLDSPQNWERYLMRQVPAELR